MLHLGMAKTFQINVRDLIGKIGLPSSFVDKTAKDFAHALSRHARKTFVFGGISGRSEQRSWFGQIATGAGKGTVKATVSGRYFPIFSIRFSQATPSRTLQILFPPEWRLSVVRRISWTRFSACTRRGGTEDVWLIFTLPGATKSQKSSVPQIASLGP